MEAVVKKMGDLLSIVIPDGFKKRYGLREQMVFEIVAKNEEIILKPKKEFLRDQLANKFNSVDLKEFEQYKRETLSPFLDMPSEGMELLDEEKNITT